MAVTSVQAVQAEDNGTDVPRRRLLSGTFGDYQQWDLDRGKRRSYPMAYIYEHQVE